MTAAERVLLREAVNQQRRRILTKAGRARQRMAPTKIHVKAPSQRQPTGLGLKLVAALTPAELDVYWRVLRACCTESVIDLSEHAALIAMTVNRVQERTRRLKERAA